MAAVVLALIAVPAAAGEPSDQHLSSPARAVQGRVVFMGEALKRLHGILTQQAAAENILAIETFEGKLIPLVEDVRGRAFRVDERLRAIDVELLAREVRDSPMLQVIGVRKLDRQAGRKYELDYWCDICAIAMYELKPCDCCQGPIELRLRELAKGDDQR